MHFLWVGDNQEADPSRIDADSMPVVALAKEAGAKLWLLEHRFYGQSRPFQRMYTKNYAYLNSQQAVEDLAYFINAPEQRLRRRQPQVGGVRHGLRRGPGRLVPHQVPLADCGGGGQLPADVHRAGQLP